VELHVGLIDTNQQHPDLPLTAPMLMEAACGHCPAASAIHLGVA
jgi:hypothetical protein